jgi:ubiquinone biosynthesis protein COQ4
VVVAIFIVTIDIDMMTSQPPTEEDPMTEQLHPVDISQLPAPQRWGRALRALAQVLVDPKQTDQVLVFSAYANAGSSATRSLRFFEDPSGAQLYAEHRTIDSRTIDLDALAALPENTLGHAYAKFLRSRGLTPEVFDEPPREIVDPRVQYVVQRARQTHDLWHVVTGCDTDTPGEVALQAFTFAQVRAPSTAILAVTGMLRSLRQRPSLPREVARAFRAGLRANPLITFPWEDHWATPLDEVRTLLGVRVQTLAVA